MTALVLGIVEGLTEFLPVSSTGHLIVAGSLLDYTGDQAKMFEIVIQAGAILAVCWEFRARLVDASCAGLATEPSAQRFAVNLVIAFLPAAVLGLAFGKFIKSHLFAPVPVACAFVIGAFVILWAERRQKLRGAIRITQRRRDALARCAEGRARAGVRAIPGTSRSGATIIGGMLFGLSRVAATEFSFFLAIPTLFAATGYELVKNRHLLAAQDLSAFGVGFAPRSCPPCRRALGRLR